MDQVSDRAREFVDRLAVQARFSDAFVRCPACSGNVACVHCVGTRRVSRATRRELAHNRGSM